MTAHQQFEQRPRDTIKLVGSQLDGHVFPMVGVGGIVLPSRAASEQVSLGEVDQDEFDRPRRSAARSWQGTTGRQRPSSSAPSIVCGGESWEYEARVQEEVDDAYPGARCWRLGSSLWIIVDSAISADLPYSARFVIELKHDLRNAVAWAFWVGALIATPQWIGPRHTNYPDGSICAFFPSDGTWVFEDKLVTLIDIFSVWALRHAFLEKFGRWPGAQHMRSRHERRWETRPGELCGCGSANKTYEMCHQSADRAANPIQDAIEFLRITGNAHRSVPSEVMIYAKGGMPIKEK